MTKCSKTKGSRRLEKYFAELQRFFCDTFIEILRKGHSLPQKKVTFTPINYLACRNKLFGSAQKKVQKIIYRTAKKRVYKYI